MRKNKKERFRCAICNKLGAHGGDYFIPVLHEGEITGLQVCPSCYEPHLRAVALANSLAMILQHELHTEEKPKKRKRKKCS